jgi:hypothetical protein
MKDRYFIDKRVGVILVIDGNIQEKQNCVQEYSNQAVRLKINGKRSSDGDWFLPAGAEDFCKSYIDFLIGNENDKEESNQLVKLIADICILTNNAILKTISMEES